MKIFLYRIYSTTLSSYHAYDFTLKADFTKAITAQVSDMAHGSLVILKILGITKSNTESKLKHHINAGFLKILLVYGITSEKFHFNITCIFHVNN